MLLSGARVSLGRAGRLLRGLVVGGVGGLGRRLGRVLVEGRIRRVRLRRVRGESRLFLLVGGWIGQTSPLPRILKPIPIPNPLPLILKLKPKPRSTIPIRKSFEIPT